VVAYPVEPSDYEVALSLELPREQVLRFDLNTLGGGPLSGAVAGHVGYDASHLTEYGDMAYRLLRAALGEKLGVAGDRILPGAGADELIRLVATATLGAGDATLIPTPSFGMFAVESRLAGARIVEVPRRDLGQRQSVSDLRAAAAREAVRLVWLCTPNNPTGDRYPLDEIRDLALDLPALVLIDEVYLEFAEAESGEEPNSGSAIRLQEQLSNVVVLRSLSKSYGAAAARVGYLVPPAGLAARFDALRLPLALAEPSEAVALGLLADEAAAVRRRREMVAERARLADALAELGCRTLPSVANFVAFRPPDATALAAALASRGMIVRSYDDGLMAGWLRAGVRDRQQTGALIDALRELLA
jgi:histidinol-phosphate aminotransferase